MSKPSITVPDTHMFLTRSIASQVRYGQQNVLLLSTVHVHRKEGNSATVKAWYRVCRAIMVTFSLLNKNLMFIKKVARFNALHLLYKKVAKGVWKSINDKVVNAGLVKFFPQPPQPIYLKLEIPWGVRNQSNGKSWSGGPSSPLGFCRSDIGRTYAEVLSTDNSKQVSPCTSGFSVKKMSPHLMVVVVVFVPAKKETNIRS